MSLFSDLFVPIIAVISGFLTIAYMITAVKRIRVETPEIDHISSHVQRGAVAYLNRQFRTISFFLPPLIVVVSIFFGWGAAITCTIGSVLSLFSAYAGLILIIRIHAKVAEAARISSDDAFRIAFTGGSIMGLLVPVLGLAGLSFLFSFLRDPEALIGFGVGSSFTALFAQVGGGIFTKAADIGADLVGKVELGIPEDDYRNPAVIADLVGDNVGDCAGRGADLFQSFSGDVITGIILGVAFAPRYGPNAVVFPLVLQSIGILASNLGVIMVRSFTSRRRLDPTRALNSGLYITAILSAVGSYIISTVLLNDLAIFYSSLSGILAVLISILVAQYYTSYRGKPVRRIAEASTRGAAINILTGLSYGFQSPLFPVIAVFGAAVFSFIVSGHSLYAVAVANIGTDLMIGFMMSSDVFGPIVDNADGVAELSGHREAADNLTLLDAVGNSMKTYTKALSMTTGTLTAVAVFATFFTVAGVGEINLIHPLTLPSFFVGVTLPFLISSLLIGSTAKTAALMVDEVRNQFRTIRGLMEGTAEPDYERCIDISTKNALKEMALPGFVALSLPIAVGLLFGSEVLISFLVGITASSVTLAIFFSNSGAAFDNAKKIIEAGSFGGKGSETHRAAVVGDTVGDPFKDVVGPSLIIFMKVVGMAALLLLPMLRI